jgi:hypothetical protein
MYKAADDHVEDYGAYGIPFGFMITAVKSSFCSVPLTKASTSEYSFVIKSAGDEWLLEKARGLVNRPSSVMRQCVTISAESDEIVFAVVPAPAPAHLMMHL